MANENPSELPKVPLSEFEVPGAIIQIKAKSIDGSHTIKLDGGDISGQQSSDLAAGGTTTISATINPGAVTESKLGTAAVATDKIKDGNVTNPKIGNSAVDMNKINPSTYDGSIGTSSSSDPRLATQWQVKDYVAGVIAGQGTYLGKRRPDVINSWNASDLRNSDHVKVEVTEEDIAQGKDYIELGPNGRFKVRNGQNMVLYKGKEDGQDVVYWDSVDGEFKVTQEAKASPDTDPDNTTTEFIDSVSQNENGDITATKKRITVADSQHDGLMPNGMFNKLDNLPTGADLEEDLNAKADKVTGATENNFAALDENGNLKDSGKDATDFATAEQGTKADSAIQGVSLNGVELQKDGNNKVNLGNLKTKQDAKSFTGGTTKTITALSQDANGEMSATIEDIPTVGENGAAKGLMTDAMLQILNNAEPSFTMEYIESRHCLKISKQVEGIPTTSGG